MKANTLEKILVNWATIPDCIFYSIRSKISKDKYQNQDFINRLTSVYQGRIKSYEKLLDIKEKYSQIPQRVKNIHYKSPCSYTRLILANLKK